MKPHIEIIEQRSLADCLIQSTKETESLFYTFPSIVRLSNGDLLLSRLAGNEKSGPKSRIQVIRSYDGGATWHHNSSPSVDDEHDDARYGYIACHITEIAENTLFAAYMRVKRFNPVEPLFHPVTDGIQPTEVRLAHSTDNGMSWSKPYSLSASVQDVIISGKALVLDDGWLALPCEIWHEWDRGFLDGPSARLLLSNDFGQSWHQDSIMAIDEKKESIFGDPRLSKNGRGNLYAMFWRYDLRSQKDYPVHAAQSSDNGRTWSTASDTGIPGQIANPVQLNNDMMLCLYQDRFTSPGLKVVFSQDSGHSWDLADPHTLFSCLGNQGGPNPFQNYQTYSFGYSSAILLPNDEILTVFWKSAGTGTDIMTIRFKVKG